MTTETWSSAPASSSDAGAGAETAETEPADDRDDRVARALGPRRRLLAARRRAGSIFIVDGGHLGRVELLDDAEVALALDLEGRRRGRAPDGGHGALSSGARRVIAVAVELWSVTRPALSARTSSLSNSRWLGRLCTGRRAPSARTRRRRPLRRRPSAF